MPRKRSTLPMVYLIAVILLLFFFCLFTLIVKSLISPVTLVVSPPREFVVELGDTTLDIAGNLHAAGLIRSPLGFRYVVKKHALGKELQAGTYYLSPTSSALEIATALTRGIADLRLTIPEGYRLEEIAAAIESELGLPRTEFLSAANGLEGRLFPDTYFLAPDSDAATVIGVMQNNFVERVGELDDDTLILASLVERETKGDDEKAIVAGILEKRLEAGWALELDATVQYALGRVGEWWPNTTLADRKVSSPYNTYLHQGLPPGPICNPGLESIKAARSPQTSDYWFYLHDRGGLIRYARTLEEHNVNIAKFIHQPTFAP